MFRQLHALKMLTIIKIINGTCIQPSLTEGESPECFTKTQTTTIHTHYVHMRMSTCKYTHARTHTHKHTHTHTQTHGQWEGVDTAVNKI